MLSERFQIELMPRVAYAVMFTHVPRLYVVGRDYEELKDVGGASCFVQQGLLKSKLTEGTRHPCIRAISCGEPVASIVDATLGLANDALHAAVVLGCPVVGIEGSEIMHALLEDGVARFHRDYGARIDLRFGKSIDVLRTLADRSHDVVMLDPMMSKPRKSAPSFALLRELALPDRADAVLLAEAARVARRRVVLKLGTGAPLPESAIAFQRCEEGAHVTYWIHDVA